jgi:hypothetical protein
MARATLRPRRRRPFRSPRRTTVVHFAARTVVTSARRSRRASRASGASTARQTRTVRRPPSIASSASALSAGLPLRGRAECPTAECQTVQAQVARAGRRITLATRHAGRARPARTGRFVTDCPARVSAAGTMQSATVGSVRAFSGAASSARRTNSARWTSRGVGAPKDSAWLARRTATAGSARRSVTPRRSRAARGARPTRNAVRNSVAISARQSASSGRRMTTEAWWTAARTPRRPSTPTPACATSESTVRRRRPSQT